MDALRSLLSDCGAPDGEIKPAENKAAMDATQNATSAVAASGTLIITACNDFDNATSKTPGGLDEPHAIDLGLKIVKTFSSSSSLHSFFLAEDGKIYALGKNDRGQLGIGNQATVHYPLAVPDFAAGASINKIVTGRSHSMFLLSNGEVYGCGSNEYGQLGLGDSKTASKDALKPVRIPFASPIHDIACGFDHTLACNDVGRLYAFGHPEYGQLGFGTNGSFIKDGGKGPNVQYRSVYTPRLLELFVRKDSRGKVEEEILASSVFIRAVAAGRNHSMCVEDGEEGRANRVFSWGFGGYGRLGHNSGDDELIPREITTFSNILPQRLGPDGKPPPMNPQKIITDIYCGNSYSLAISKAKNLYFWGKLSNSPRGESQVYPKMVDDLQGWRSRLCTGGSNSVFVAADDSVIAWGVPVAGKFGLEGGAKSTTTAKIVSAVAGLQTLDISAGYGHVCFVVSANQSDPAAKAKLAAFPVLPAPATPAAVGGKGGSKDKKEKQGGAAGKKRGAEAPVAAGPGKKKSK